MTNTTTMSHRWHLEIQKSNDDWARQISSAYPIQQTEVDRYQNMDMFKDSKIRIIHEVITTTVERTRVEGVSRPIPVND